MKKTFLSLITAAAMSLLIAGCSSNSDGDSDPSPPVIEDPAPLLNDPGEYGCDGCPDSEITEFTLRTSDSKITFSDVVLNAIGEGVYYVKGADGSAIIGSVATALSGAFSVELPMFCGTQLVKFVWSNESGSYVLVFEVEREDCTNADIQVTLTWDDLGLDYELHLIKEGGRINDDLTDCTWTSCLGSGPDWGVIGDDSDNPLKDIDNQGNFGPENIYLSSPENITYTVMVEHWGSGDPESDGSVTFNVAGETVVANVVNFPSRHVWHVGTIEWPSGEVVLDGTITDCSANWDRGCQLELPLPTVQ